MKWLTKTNCYHLSFQPMSPREPPACVQNAMMNKDKKPFTYTPGGLDLSQIRSEKMARRLMINAMSPGVQEKPAHPSFTPSCETPPVKPPMNYYALPVPVFPVIQIPTNPKTLLRRTSGPYNRSESIDRALEKSEIDTNDEEKTPTADSINKLDNITPKETFEPKNEIEEKLCLESEPEVTKPEVKKQEMKKKEVKKREIKKPEIKKPESPKILNVPDVPKIPAIMDTKGNAEPTDKGGQCLLSCLNLNRDRSPSPFKLETTSDKKEPSFLSCQNNKTRDRSPSPFRLETNSDIKENGFHPSQISERPCSPIKTEMSLLNGDIIEETKTKIEPLITESPQTKNNFEITHLKETENVTLDKPDEDGDVTPKIGIDTKLFESVLPEMKNKENNLPVAEEEEKVSVGDIISRFNNKSVSPVLNKEKIEKKEVKNEEKKEVKQEIIKEIALEAKKEEKKEESFLRENRDSISSRRNTENIKSLNNDLDSLPSLSLCSKRFSFLGDNSTINEKDAFSILTGVPEKMSLIDRKDNKISTVKQISHVGQNEIKEPPIQPPKAEILPPWKLIENDIPLISSENKKSIDSKCIQDSKWKPAKPIDSLLQPLPQSNEYNDLCKSNSWNKSKPAENLVPVNDNSKDDTEPAWKRELREIASQKRESKQDSDFYREDVEPPWRRELRELSESKLSRGVSQSRLSRDMSQSTLSRDASQSRLSRDVSQSRLSRDVSESRLSRETSESRMSQPRELSQSRLSRGSSLLETSFDVDPPWKPSCKLNYSKSDADDKTASVINPLWSQTIRPKTWRERKADLSRDKEVEVPEWKKVGDLRRNFVNSFLNKSTSSSSSCSSPAREIGKTPEITVEIAGNPTSTPAVPSNNGYTYPWESSSESSAAFSPEPYTFDRTPTPQSRNSPFRQTPNYVYADMHSPSIPR